MAFTEIANKSPLLDLGSELCLEKPFRNDVFRFVPLSYCYAPSCYFLLKLYPLVTRGRHFLSVWCPKNDCLGESMSLEKLEKSLLWAYREDPLSDSAQRLYSELFKYVTKRARLPYTGLKKKKIIPSWGKFRKLNDELFFLMLFSNRWDRRAIGLHNIPNYRITSGRKQILSTRR